MREGKDNQGSFRWWAVAVIVAAACGFCWPVFLGRVMLPADMCLLMLPWRELQGQFPDFYRPHNPMLDPIQQYLPWRIYAVESIRSGFVPLWNPYAFCGTPFLANLQSTVLYPLNAIFLLTGARQGFGVSAILHLILGGLFMFALLRTLSLRRPAALFGALVVMFNGFTVAWLEFPTMSLWVFVWLPALLLCYERAVRTPGPLWPLLCATLVGVQFVGGHLQISAYVLMTFAIYAVLRVAKPIEGKTGRRRGVTVFVVSLALGLALASAQLLPTLELARHSGRVDAGTGAAISTAFPLTHFILYLVPNFFGNPVDYNYWGGYRDPTALNFFETACYVGIPTLFLAAWGLRRRADRRVWFFGTVTLFALLVAVGSPLYLALYYLAPGFRELAGLGRILCLAAFGLAGLAAIGMDDLIELSERRQIRWVLIGAAATLALAVGAAVALAPYWRELPAPMEFGAYLCRQIGLAVGLTIASALLLSLRLRRRLAGSALATLAILLLLVDLFVFGIGFNPFVDAKMAYPEMKSIQWLRERAGHSRVTSLASNPVSLDWMPHNSPMIFGLRDIHGSDSLRVRSSFELVSGPDLAQSVYPPPESPLMDALGVRYLMTRREVGKGWRRRLVRDGDVPIYENREALPRAYVVPDNGGLDMARIGMGSPRDRGNVRFVRDAPNEVALEMEGNCSGILVLMDSYYPGWQAHVYESPAGIVRVNEGFRAVRVPPGKQVVTFEYEPVSFLVGLFVSLLAMTLLAVWGMGLYVASAERVF